MLLIVNLRYHYNVMCKIAGKGVCIICLDMEYGLRSLLWVV